MNMLRVLAFLLAGIASGQSVEFVHISDTHVMRIDGIDPALVLLRQVNVLSATQLENYLDKLRPSPPDFFIHTGDVLEAFRYDKDGGGVLDGQIERFQAIHKRSPAPMYLALGNRDVSWYRAIDGKQVVVRDQAITSEARAAWRKSFECFRDGTWYSFEKHSGNTDYLFAVLDNGDTADEPLMQRQLAWLRGLLARSKPAALVLALHIPLGENAFGQAVKEILAGFYRPVLVLAGHRHTDGVEEFSATPRRVQVRTASFAGGKLGARRIALTPSGILVHETNDPGRLLLTLSVGDTP